MTTPTPIEAKIDEVTSTIVETPNQEEKDLAPASEIDQTGKDKPEGELPPTDPVPEPVKEPVIDHKKKFRESSSEANRLLSVARTQHEIIKTFTTEDQVSDDEMRTIHDDYDDMSPADQNRWKRLEMESRRNNRILADQKTRELAQAKETAIKLLVESNPLLEKNAEEFKKFVEQPENALVDASTLAKSFLYDLQDQDPPIPSETIPAKPEPTMERGTANKGVIPEVPNQVKKPEEMNDDELADLMVREPRKYMEHVRKMATKKR